MSGYQDISCAMDGHVMVLTLNRPEKLNAYTANMGAEICDAFERASADDDVRCVVVTGAGRAFCAGADISAGAGAFDTSSAEGSLSFGDVSKQRRGGGGMVGAVYDCAKPSIVAFNGAAVGVGVTLALPMDIKIASQDARFGFVFARRGLVPEAGSAWFLPRLVGVGTALRWCLEGNLIGADEALRAGLVSEVTPPGKALERAMEIASHIATQVSPVSAAITRQMLWRLSQAPSPHDVLALDGVMAMERGKSPDVREGVASFIEKRAPQFSGRVSRDMPPQYPWWED
jgi:enoyl-CoA hydratase/carnithine racemase